MLNDTKVKLKSRNNIGVPTPLYGEINFTLSYDRAVPAGGLIIVSISGTVRCYPRYDDATNATVIQTSELSATFKGLKPSTDYAIQVRAKTTRGWGEYTPVIFKKTPHAMGLGKRVQRHLKSHFTISFAYRASNTSVSRRLRRRGRQHAS